MCITLLSSQNKLSKKVFSTVISTLVKTKTGLLMLYILVLAAYR